MIRALDKRVRGLASSVRFAFGFCPAGCKEGGIVSTGVVYRSSRRSIQMRCSKCGLLWTMTVHQMAKAARVHAEASAAAGDAWADGEKWIADELQGWAKHVDDKRGRRPVMNVHDEATP
jgi:hypothetical protein